MRLPFQMEFTGTVVRKPFAPASKSAHDALWLQTVETEYKLEREGGNPFRDPDLDALEGKQIACGGIVLGPGILRISSWRVVE